MESIAGESPDQQQQREELKKRVDRLKKGIQVTRHALLTARMQIERTDSISAFQSTRASSVQAELPGNSGSSSQRIRRKNVNGTR